MYSSGRSQRSASHISVSSNTSTSQTPSTWDGHTIAGTSRSKAGRQQHGRPGTARPRTAVSTIGIESQQIICALSESRGISPTVGLAFVNLDTGEAVLSQICDSQTYVRTIHKLAVFSPSQILLMDTSSNPRSKLFSIIEENLIDLNSNIMLLDRRYWAETTGIEYIQQFAFSQDVESIKMAVSGNYFSVCCFAAVRIACSRLLHCKAHILTGAQIYRAQSGQDFPYALTQDQVRSIRRLYDDRPVDHPFVGA